MDSDQLSQESYIDVDGQLSPPSLPEQPETSVVAASETQDSASPVQSLSCDLEGYAVLPAAVITERQSGGIDASRDSCSDSSEDSHVPTADSVPEYTSAPALVSFRGFENGEGELHEGNAEAGPDQIPRVRVQPSQLLVRRLSRSQSKLLRRSSMSASNAGGYLQDIVPVDLPRESKVGFMCPPLAAVRPPDDIKKETCPSFRRNRSLNRCQPTTRIADDAMTWQRTLSSIAQGRSQGHGDSALPPRTLPVGMQIPLPMVAVTRHMHPAARRAILQTMLGLGPDGSEFARYTPIFAVLPVQQPVYRLCRTDEAAEVLAQRMELICARVVHEEVAPQTLRSKVYALLSDPSSTRAARGVSVVILSGICVSTAAYCYETMPGVPSGPAEANRLQMVEVGMVALFTAEYIARLVCCPHLREFLMSPMNAIDLLSVLPYYVSLLSQQLLGGWARRGVTRVLRVVRLVRVFRIVKVGARYKKIRIIANVVKDTMEILWLLVLLVALAVLVFSTLVYYIELMELQAEPDDPRVTFRSIPGTFWWSVVTLLTVGYGDTVPGTTSGKIIAAISMVVAVLLMALPVSVIGTTFTQQWVMFRAKERREARTANSYDTLCDLVRRLSEHAQAMAEIRAAVEKCCVRLRVCLHDMYRNEEAMRGVYISGISGGLPPSLAASQLSVKLDRFNEVLVHARRTYTELQCVLQVAEPLMEPGVIALAHSMDETYLQLSWWFVEGHRVLVDYSRVMERTDAVEELLASQPPLRRIRF